jgi:hypothetical protein
MLLPLDLELKSGLLGGKYDLYDNLLMIMVGPEKRERGREGVGDEKRER